jgi:FkbM family methyltransferase
MKQHPSTLQQHPQASGASLPARLARESAHAAHAVVKTRSLAYPRILWRILRKPRLTPGSMRFPFGRIRYVDTDSLRTTYYQIFVEGIYQVDGLGAAPTIIDCGGNIGLSVIAFKQRYPQARILTFEADPALAAVLAWNVKALGLSDVTVEAQAVGAVDGHVMFQPDGAVDGHVVASHATTMQATGITVPAVRLSDQMDRIDGPVDLLKMDIEGSEYDVIADLCQSGRIAQVKTLICEVHGNPDTQRQVGELWRQLTEAGFRLSLFDARVDGDPREAPFSVIRGRYYAVIVYAWRP